MHRSFVVGDCPYKINIVSLISIDSTIVDAGHSPVSPAYCPFEAARPRGSLSTTMTHSLAGKKGFSGRSIAFSDPA
jgi:hypothetical protein